MAPPSHTNRLQDPEALADVTALAYDAAADPSIWPRFLERVADVLELRAANFGICHTDGLGAAVMVPASWGFSETEIADYETHFAAVDPHRIPALSMPTGAVGTLSDIVPDEDLVRSEYFNDFYARVGLRRGLSSLIHNEGGGLSVLACHRGPDQRPASDEDLEFLRRLTPHLQRARKLSIQLGTLETREKVLFDVLDRLPVGLVFVDAMGGLVRANSRGERILIEGDGLGVSRGMLVAERARDTQKLAAAIANARRPDVLGGAGAPTSIRLPRPSGGRDLEVMVCPIDRRSTTWSDDRAAAFLVVGDGAADLTGVALRMQDLYGLSAAEAALAVALANGATVKSWAEERGVSVETVRWQLKQVFSKTGTSRQPELIRLMLLGPALLR